MLSQGVLFLLAKRVNASLFAFQSVHQLYLRLTGSDCIEHSYAFEFLLIRLFDMMHCMWYLHFALDSLHEVLSCCYISIHPMHLKDS